MSEPAPEGLYYYDEATERLLPLNEADPIDTSTP